MHHHATLTLPDWTPRWLRDLGLDRLAIGLSGLCAVHCLASAVLVALAASAGGLLLNPIIHEVGLTIAVVLGSVALIHGAMRHGFLMPVAVGAFGLGTMAGAATLPHDGGNETLFTLIGVAILALGHDLNRRAAA
ncbi:MerC domain-containing protein [Sphingomonas sp. GlSt437]|uniref:MerC domain-containing protein n=1 Tax=Sphingomonas sp. GlSt437 TaxID=3389970 RepID=UPI003A835241